MIGPLRGASVSGMIRPRIDTAQSATEDPVKTETRIAWMGGAALLAPAAALAHPGHGSGAPWSALHYLSEPEHLAIGAIAVLLVAGIVRFRRLRSRRATVRPR